MQFFRNKAATCYCAIAQDKTIVIRFDDLKSSFTELPFQADAPPHDCYLISSAQDFQRFADRYLQNHLVLHHKVQDLLKAPAYDT